MFITVLYGDNEEALFNLNCKVQLLLESMKSCCHPESEGDVDLADESGQVKNLLDNQQLYASEILAERETYVLLAVTKTVGSTDAIFTPLLNDEGIVNPKFLAKLGNWGESKLSGRKSKQKKQTKKNTVVVSTPPDAAKPSASTRKRSLKP
ncbi:uncharacterized protein CXorf65 homolog [Spea bombifrons]|uniref:uncharacterized protein CXorf65 homolog n=1 Tax=Spea bombifrons TaxID=233779 RepID=UPI00234B0E29|nr:uncharacterized protein CXorf65 homolog [Spea bombifrons]